MSKFFIPDTLVPGFEALANLSDKDVKSIIDTLKSMPVGIGPEHLENQLLEKLSDTENLRSLSNTLFSFGSLLSELEMTDYEELANDLVSSYLKKKEANKDTQEKLLSILTELFDSSEILIKSFKAAILLTDHDKIFKNCRVLTDIRMLFEEDLTIPNRHSLLIHTLKIDYSQDNTIKSFYVALDANDLKKLKNQITRAEKKEVTLKSQLEGISLIPITDSK